MVVFTKVNGLHTQRELQSNEWMLHSLVSRNGMW